jgi:hypothetical protein
MADLADDAFRNAIKAQALANISGTSSYDINRVLQQLFPGRGKCYVQVVSPMVIRYVFEFPLTPDELNIILYKGIIPRPCGVEFSVLQI